MAISGGPDIVEDGLVLHLDAADKNSYPGSGSTWYDLSGNGNNGTLTNGPTFSSANAGALVFDGSNDYVDIGGATNFFPSGSQTHNLSISLWVKLPTTSTNIFFGQQNTSNQRLYISTYGGYWDMGWGQYAWGTNGATGTFVASSTDWTHLTLRVLNGIATLYVNSIESISKTDTTVDLQGILPVGAYYLYNSFDNQYSLPNSIAQTSIYNRALSANEVQQNYNATKGRFGL
jgi:hypothetical protein